MGVVSRFEEEPRELVEEHDAGSDDVFLGIDSKISRRKGVSGERFSEKARLEREREGGSRGRTAMVCDDAVQISKGNCQNQNDHTG